MKTIAGAAVAVCICLATLWIYANASSVPRFTYSNTEEIA